MKTKNLLITAFFVIFMVLGIMALKEGMPSERNERVYPLVQKHIPYVIEKRAGGLSIKSKITGIKEKPPAKEVFLRLEQLEKQWARDFLKLDNQTLVIMDKDKKDIAKIVLQSSEEIRWAKEYFEIK